MLTHAVYFHALGQPQAHDRLVDATSNQPGTLRLVDITKDGRYVTLCSTPGTTLANTLAVVDLQIAGWKPRKPFEQPDKVWSVVGNEGTSDVVPQDVFMSAGTLVGGRLMLSCLVDVKTEVRRFTLEGKADGVVRLPGIGTAVGFDGAPGDPETFFGFTSYKAPGMVFVYDVAGRGWM